MEGLGSLAKRRVRIRARGSSSSILSQFIAKGFGIGYLPLAPGTWASLATSLFIYFLHTVPGSLPRVTHAVLVILLFPIAWMTARHTARALGEMDPKVVVIDEIFGQMFCLLWFPITAVSVIGGFALFRFFDIVKPFPVKQAERIKGGLGIVMDDLVASLYASVIIGLFYAS